MEPTSKWAAFYSGLTAPVLLTTAMKDAAKAQKELEDIETKLSKSQQEKRQLIEDKQKLLEVIESLNKKVDLQQNPEVIESDADSNLQLEESQRQSINIRQSQVSGQIGQAGRDLLQVGRDYTYSFRSNRGIFFYFILAISILVIVTLGIIRAYNSSASAILVDVLRVVLCTFLGLITLTIIIILLKRLKQNQSFKEFLKGL